MQEDTQNKKGCPSALSRAKHRLADMLGLTERKRLRRKARKLELCCKDTFQLVVDALFDRNEKNGLKKVPAFKGVATAGSRDDVVKLSLPDVDWTQDAPENPDYCFVWSYKPALPNFVSAATAARTGAPMIACEDGFLRSADTFANRNAPPRFNRSCSVVLDTLGFYFDATRHSVVENMLNDRELVLTEAQIAEARRLIDRIVSSKLTKYNHQPIFTPEIGRSGRQKVLVVDQSYGDMAIAKGWGSEELFAEMLESAKRENPDADILVKTHPDTMTGTRSGYFVDVKEEGNVFRVTMPVNPYSLMELVDKVYVCSTQMGFEALMAGKEVHVYGMPFYAGWGLTVDKQKNPRRTNRRTLEEMFYIFYLMYTHWVDIETGKPCSIDKAMDNLIALREEYGACR